MTAQPDSNVLPLRPADERAGLAPKAQYAPERAREADAAEPRPERRHITLRMPSVPSARLLSGVLQGGSLLATAAPAILAWWEGHVVAAKYFRHWWARYPRLAYGFWHAFIEAPVGYLFVWSGRTPLLRLLIYASLIAVIHLCGGHLFWRYL
jgi:hypothetical protein